MQSALFTGIACLLLATTPVSGHHSTASYDLIHGTILDGVVTRYVWENPHMHIYLDVAGENAVEHWTIELESPNLLRRFGWEKDTLKPGNHILVTGGRAKNGTFNLRAITVDLPDGRKLPAVPPPEN